MLALVILLSTFFSTMALPNILSSDMALQAEILKHTTECASKVKVDFDVCMEMLKVNNDNSQEKYSSCKCLIPCVAKKMKVMTEDGKFNENAIKKRIDSLKTPKLKEEANRVFPICKNVDGLNCDAGFKIYTCVLENSEMAKDVTLKLMDILKG